MSDFFTTLVDSLKYISFTMKNGRKPNHSFLSLGKKGHMGENQKVDFGQKNVRPYCT